MTTNSLAFRLFVAAALWVVAVLGIAGLALAAYQKSATERAFDERLHAYLKTLVADIATLDPGQPARIGALGEPNFELPLQGWYWRITELDKREPTRFASPSLFGETMPTLDPGSGSPGALRSAYVIGPKGALLRLVERTIDLGTDGRFDVAVSAPAAEIERVVSDFRHALVLAFVLVGVGLVAATLLQVRYGLAPLHGMSATLRALRAGEARKMPEGLPAEIDPLARELDALVDSNRQTVERARTHVGNLAHALKTPLSVIANEAAAAGGGLAGKLREQVDIMRRQIDHHLQRARIAAAVDVVGTVTPVRDVVEALARTMEKINRAKQLSILITVDGEPRFRGERQDLEEMIGNLLDNAAKWSGGEVTVSVSTVADEGKQFVRISIGDDGPGVPESRRAELGKRGKRLDETVPGTGLGLSIVADLAGLYGGKLSFDKAEAGGLMVKLDLPSV